MSVGEEVKALVHKRGPGTRVRVVGGSPALVERVQKELTATDPQPSNVRQDVDDDALLGRAAAIEPPYDPLKLLIEIENSNALRQNLDAYAQNIVGFGWTFEPVFELDDEDIDRQVADALYMDALVQSEQDATDFDPAYLPDQSQIDNAKSLIAQRMRIERQRLDLFFDFCCSDRSFTQLRKDTRYELEGTGNGYWEVLRNGAGKLTAFSYVPGFTVRAVDLSTQEVVERQVPIRVSPLRWGTRTELHHGKRWVQVLPSGDRPIFFKEFGDARVVSSRTGSVYEDVDAMQAAEPDANPATELIQFRIHSPRSGNYGVPRWIGNLKSVMGSRKAETVNLLYFNNKSVPPLALLVSGGSITDEAVTRIEDYIQNELHGDEANFHKILIIEAEPAGDDLSPMNSGKIKVELVPLTKAMNTEGLFMKYIAAGRDMIGESMRNPKIVRGATDQINRATAQAALDFAEAQVYQPERASDDWWINRFVMPELGILFWRFHSNSPVSTDLEAAKAIVDLTKVGVLTPAEARRLTSRVFNVELRRLTAQWVSQPLQLTLAGILMSEESGGFSTGQTERQVESMLSGSAKRLAKVVRDVRARGGDVVEELAKLMEFRAIVVDHERTQANEDFAHTKALDEAVAEEVTIRVPGPISDYFVPSKSEPDANA